MPEAVAVTGGNGRVGKHVLEHLASEGYRTVNLSRGKREEDHSDAYIRTDLLDAGEVYGALAKGDPDAVVHLGMIPSPEQTPGYRTYESNVMSSYHVLEAAGELGVDTAVLASSFSAIGGGFEPDAITVDYLPVDETHRWPGMTRCRRSNPSMWHDDEQAFHPKWWSSSPLFGISTRLMISL